MSIETNLADMIDESVIFLSGANVVTCDAPYVINEDVMNSLDIKGMAQKYTPLKCPSNWKAAFLGGPEIFPTCHLEVAHGYSLGFMGKQKAFGRNISAPACTAEIVGIKTNGDVLTKRNHYFYDHGGWCDPFKEKVKLKCYPNGDVSEIRYCDNVESSGLAGVLFIMYCHRYRFFRIRIGYEGGLPVQVPTDAMGVKEWFRLRDVPEGKTRREALVHWVKEHWRKIRYDPIVETQVREHLRGATKFSWFGMESAISIPEAFKEKEMAILERKRTTGPIRRVASHS